MVNKKLIIVSSCIIVVLFTIYLIVSLTSSKVDPEKSSLVKEPEVFFKVQDIINSELQKEETRDFIYIANKMYVKSKGYDSYYFINGMFITHEDETEESDYDFNRNYFVLLNGNSYNIERIYTDNVEEYSKDFDMNSRKLTNPQLADSFKYEEKNKIVFYIAYYNTLFNNNPQAAYSLLSDNMKEKYSAYSFEENGMLLTPLFERYDKTTKGKNTIYTIKTNSNTITIIEASLMDFKIEY